MEDLASWWVIVPPAMIIIMFVMMSRIFFSRCWWSGIGPMCMGPMRDTVGQGDENRTSDDRALDVLPRRYASRRTHRRRI